MRTHKSAFKSMLMLIFFFVEFSGLHSKIQNEIYNIEEEEIIDIKIKVPANKIQSSDSIFIGKEILSRPTDRSMTLHLIPALDLDIFIDYGTDSFNFSNKTGNFQLNKDSAFQILIDDLQPDRECFYRLNIKEKGTSNYSKRNINRFHTQRTDSFVFAIEADPHLDSNSIPDAYSLTLSNILNDKPDFLIDIGDNFMCEKLSEKSQKNITERHLLLRSFYEQTCHSVPLFLVLGNHEGEWGSLTDNNAKNLSILASNTRKFYFSNPEPDNFYSGNTKSEEKVGLRQNYYSWEWGNALFVVLDPYWYTNPKTGWGMTLGADQYNWFKNVLSASKSKFKFVFCHNLVGGANKDMRGGVEAADFYEWGGRDTNNVWSFDKNRPGWDKTIHQIMVENGVSIFFHGHDHFYGYQEKDGIIYQEIPQPSNRNLTNLSAGSYGYKSGTLLPGRGYLRVTVSDTAVNVEYVKTLLPNEEKGQEKNRDIAHSYIVKPRITSIYDNLNIESKRIKIYPNPSKEQISIEGSLPNCSNASLKIFEMSTGKLVVSFEKIDITNGNFKFIWNFEKEIVDGAYFCELKTNNFETITKFIINRANK